MRCRFRGRVRRRSGCRARLAGPRRRRWRGGGTKGRQRLGHLRGRLVAVFGPLGHHPADDGEHARRQPRLETLERRRLYTVSVVQGYPGYYEVRGTDASEAISIAVSSADSSFTLDGVTYPGAAYVSRYRVKRRAAVV